MLRIRKALALLPITLFAATLGSATTFTLADGNSVLQVSDTDPRGAYNWTVDGVDLLYQQWFWYRIDNDPEQSLDKLQLMGAATFGGVRCSVCGLDLLYGGRGFTIEITYSLRGGQAGSHTADIGEQITINNNRATSLDLHFFQYSDFNLNQVDGRDYVDIDPSYHSVSQTPAALNGPMMSETTVNQRPSHAEAGVVPFTVDRLNDGSPTVLNDVLAAGPGNVSWTFEWDHVIPRFGSYLISKDKMLAPVPEPVSLVLVGSLLIFGARRLRPNLV